MGRPEYRTVKLTAAEDGREGPADGQEVSVSQSWVWLAMVGGELLVFDSDGDPAAAMAILGRVPDREQFAQYWQDEDHPGIYRFVGYLRHSP